MSVVFRNLGLLVALAAVARPVGSQQIRITGVTSFHYLSIRPLEDDSIAAGDAIGNGLLRQSPDGHAVRCVGNDPFCRFRRTGSSAGTMPVIQDLSINVWGLARGVRLYSRLRGRAMVVGDQALWPRGDDVLDVMAVFVEMNRTSFRGRAGRLWKTSGLGYYNFDGASILLNPVRQITLEAYGGWSLARGLNESVTSQDLALVEPFAPDARSYILGAQVGFRPRSGTAVTATYQRELRDDRLGLYSERLAVDAFARAGASTVDGVLKLDLATAVVNEGRLRVWFPRLGDVALNAYVRHHSPYFDLWTIWGAFTPLGFDEFGISGSWRRRERPLVIEVFGASRRYRGVEADELFGSFRTDGWRLGASASSNLGPAWSVSGNYRAEIGFGAAKSEGGVSVQHAFSEGNYVAVNASAFQRLYEFRVDDATVFALGADAAVRRGPAARLVGNITVYRHTGSTLSINNDWTQIRGTVRFEWTLGTEPVVRRPIGARP